MILIKKRSLKSNKWLKEQLNNKYTQIARRKNFRSRAWFKLDHIQCNNKLFYPGLTVIDLGASPGGWSQYVSKIIGKTGQVFAYDILPMKPISGVKFFQKNCFESNMIQTLLEITNKKKINIVLSDMSPNISGIAEIDIPKSIYLAKLALNICQNILVENGNFIVKIFQGEGFDKYLQKMKSKFSKVKICKPIASRMHSREVYIIGKNLKK